MPSARAAAIGAPTSRIPWPRPPTASASSSSPRNWISSPRRTRTGSWHGRSSSGWGGNNSPNLMVSERAALASRTMEAGACFHPSRRPARKSAAADLRIIMLISGKPEISAGLLRMRAEGSPHLLLQPWDDVARERLDLLLLVFVGNEDDAVDAGREVRLELLDALLRRAHDGAVHGRFRPRRVVPFGLQPVLHRRLDLVARADADRQLVGGGQFVRIAPGLLGVAAHACPRAGETLDRVIIREPAVALRRRALEHGVDVAADQDRRSRLLHRFRLQHCAAQIVRRIFAGDPLLAPQPGDDLEALLHQLAAPVEIGAHGI